MKSKQALPFKHEMYELAGTYKLLAEKADAETRLDTEVSLAAALRGVNVRFIWGWRERRFTW